MIPWVRDLCALAVRAVDALESIADSLKVIAEPVSNCPHGTVGFCNPCLANAIHDASLNLRQR